MNYFKEKGKVIKVPIEDYKHLEEDCKLKEHYAFNTLSLKLDEYIEDWHWYDREMFEWYRHSGMSIRKIAASTTISWVSIFNTLKDCKLKVKQDLKQDYETYKKETS